MKEKVEVEAKKSFGSTQPVFEKALEEKVAKKPIDGVGDVSKLRKLWPDVIEEVKKKRRLTWSLLSASAQVLS